MKIIVRNRGGGKTTELLKISHTTGCVIVCMNFTLARMFMRQAEEEGLKIPHPITYDDLIEKRIRDKKIKGLLIDDLDLMLKYMAQPFDIGAVTMSMDDGNHIDVKRVEFISSKGNIKAQQTFINQ